MSKVGLDDALHHIASYRGWSIARTSGNMRITDEAGRHATVRIRRSRNAWWLETSHEQVTVMLCTPEPTLIRALGACRWHLLVFSPLASDDVRSRLASAAIP